jgi:aspartyl-tRNA(Asn)/glutamyl-tRNA(Gln) amidotransferase subunit B
MKNLNSFRAIIRAIEGEYRRQIDEIESGGKIVQETRRWDDSKAVSYSIRSKEEAHDYRYFPEPDLMPIVVDEDFREEIRRSLPELPEARKKRYIEQYGLPTYDASILTASKVLADFFEDAAGKSSNAKTVSNWIMGDLLRVLKDKNMEVEQIPFPADYLAKLIALIDQGKINRTIAKKVFEKMFNTNNDPEAIVKDEGLEGVSDEGTLILMVRKILENNPQSIVDYKAGKDKAFGFLVGQAMRESKGKADPQLINKLLKEELDK